ncbi:MAG: hypothetical protein KDI90_02505 [Alphaproteobacteria bacterium]|nr:hypothetical protein [Alphaproteobacteria bacterium]
MMRFLAVLLVLLSSLFVFAQNPAFAGPKPWSWGWWPGHWRNLDFKPYLGNQQLSQRSLWDNDNWTPEAWIKDAGDEKRIIRDFYAADIVSDQYVDGDNIPVLVVGDNFMKLSGLDRRRVLKFVDHVFGITQAEDDGMFYVYYRELDDDPLGVYNKYGLQQY